MRSDRQSCGRLLLALEDLVAAEEAAFGASDFTTAVEIQQRTAPIVDYLARHAPAVADREFRARLDRVVHRRADRLGWLSGQITNAQEELKVMQVSQQRVARVAPAYTSSFSPVTPRLSAIG
ncbi:MAG: hypothetical protein RL077_5740 [Verrucomicrobiota bacterium]|jgi:hypothetical protein